MSKKTNQRPPLAIVGLSALFPGSSDATGFWRDIMAGKDLIGDIPETHWLTSDFYDPDPKAKDKTYAKRGGFLNPVDFDALHWGVPPSIIEATDTSQLLALIVAEQVLKDAAKGQFESMDRSRISCILGVTSAQELLATMVSRLQKPIWVKSLREHGLPESDVQKVCDRISDHYVPWQESSFPGLLGNVVAGRIANRLDLGGTNCVTDAACASTFSALSMAVRELYLGDSDMVITGGVDTLNDIFMYMCFSKTPALSMTGDCRPFSNSGDGTMLGEGLGMIAIKRLDDAERDGDRIYAVLNGVGSSSDGRSKSVYAPVSKGQSMAIDRAYENAGFSTSTVELVEGHGTGTKAGDAAEFGGLELAFNNNDREDKQWCALGSVKSQIGHTKAAAGAAGLFKAVMALQSKSLPPTIKVSEVNDKLDIQNTAFYINTEARPWIRGSDHPRRAGVSSFGFGGSNFHLALEEYKGELLADRKRILSAELVVLTGANGAAVAKSARELAGRATADGMLHRLAWESAQDFDANANARLAVVATDEADLAAKLNKLAGVIDGAPTDAFTHPDGSAYGVGKREGGVAFVFPGQGSQYTHMGSAVAMAFDAARGPWDRAADMDLGDNPRIDQMVFPRPKFSDAERTDDETALRATEWAQPAIGTSSLALLEMMRALGVNADAVAGHSFGEITALHAAGVFDEAAMLGVARKRGELMAAASETPGAMSAVSADIKAVDAMIKALGRKDVVVANHNHPTQVVISGTIEGVDAAESKLSADGVRFTRLAVGTAFHSPVVADATKPFGAYLSDVKFSKATTTVWSGESAEAYESTAPKKRARLARQIANPVRFVSLLEGMADSGIQTFIEVGPGSVLTGLVGRTLKGRAHTAIALDRKGKDGIVSLNRGLAAMVAAGIELDLNALWEGYGEPEDIGARTPPKLAVPICGANYGKAYPPKGGTAALPPPNPEKPAAVATPVAASAPIKPAVSSLAASTPSTQTPKAPVEVPMSTNNTPQPTAGWLAAWSEALNQSANAHNAYQQSMAASHNSYMNTVESAIHTLATMGGGTAAPMATRTVAAPVAIPMAAPVAVAAPVAIPLPAPVPVAAPVAIAAPAPAPAPAPIPVAAPVVAAPAPAPAPVAAPAGGGVDLQALMLEVVADKTGYPAEMLDMSMNLEGDLGIDSIKRVEILAAVQEQAPGMPDVDPAHMGTLNTLGEIVEYMQSLMGDAPAAAPAAAAPAPAPVAAPAGGGVDLQALMLEVVAEKTGYPAEMLDMTMNLEGDLGIDSIKRVEILAAVQEQAPGMPDVDPAYMGTLNTLGEIVEYMQSLMGGPPAAAPAAAAAAPAAAPAGGGVDLQALMLEVVAEKTGYPAEMLDMTMNLEGDLGIDSIKRVEILAAVQEQAPGMPDVDPAHMGTLNTLGEIVEYMQSLMGGPPTTPTAAPVPQKGALSEKSDLGRFPVTMVDASPIGMAPSSLLNAKQVLVTGSGNKLTDALVKVLVGRGVNAVAAKDVPAGADAVIFMGGLRPVSNEEEAIAIERECYAIARTLAPTLTKSGGYFVTVQDTGGAFSTTETPSERALLSGISGLAKTAQQEWPLADVRAIDLNVAAFDDAADALANELLTGGVEVELGLSAPGKRVMPATVYSVAEPATQTINKGDVVVISGGGRGVTASCAIALAADTKATMLLLGRSKLFDEPASCANAHTDVELKRALLADAKAQGVMPKPAELGAQVRAILSSREVRGTIAAINAAGGRAEYRPVSILDAKSVATTLAEARTWGPITGLVHGAGVLADKKIVDQTDEQFDRVFNTKVEGFRTLLKETAKDKLRAICTFSSISARTGNNGQSTYAIANEVLNKMCWAEYRRRKDCIVKSIGWGPWEGGMVTAGIKAHFEAMGVPLIPIDVGAAMFSKEVQGANPTEVEMVFGGQPTPEPMLTAASDTRSLKLSVTVNAASHGYLAGHATGGAVVVPVALVMEWFSRAANALQPDRNLVEVTDLKVLSGIKISNFADAGVTLTVEASLRKTDDASTISLMLTGEKGRPHYSAVATLIEGAAPAPRKLTQPKTDAWNGKKVYGDVLFHTDDFQMLTDVTGVSSAGITAKANGVHAAKWGFDDWQTDVAAVDAALQLGLLWARETMGGAALPMGVGKFQISAVPPQGEVECVAQCRTTSAQRATADIQLVANGVPFATLSDVALIIRPDA